MLLYIQNNAMGLIPPIHNCTIYQQCSLQIYMMHLRKGARKQGARQKRRPKKGDHKKGKVQHEEKVPSKGKASLIQPFQTFNAFFPGAFYMSVFFSGAFYMSTFTEYMGKYMV